MTLFLQLQQELHLESVALRPKGVLEFMVRHVVANSSGPDGVAYTPSDTFAITFASYIAFYTRREEYFPPDRYDKSDGEGFRVFSQSRLLECVRATAFSENLATRKPHDFHHYGIYCQEELIDVLAEQAPALAYLGQTIGWSNRGLVGSVG